MSTATEVSPVPATDRFQTLLVRGSDYLSLARPRIAIMVLVTVTVGYLLGQRGSWASAPLWHAWLGITLVTAGSSAFNQWWEQATDARMRRTRNRALPAGRLYSIEVLMLATSLSLGGCGYLWLTVNLLTAVLAGATCLIYAFVYTPLKRWTSLCTAIGAIPGAMPPVLGWTAAGGTLDLSAFALFGLMFMWQFPHFLAIAWLHQDDYAAAGLRMLPGRRPMPRVTGLMATAYALCLIPVSLIPGWLGMAGSLYSLTAIMLGLVYAWASIQFAWNESRPTAKRVLWVSLIYLPVMLAVLAGDHLRLLQ